MQQTLKLFYFDIAGKGESIRLLCAHSNLPLEDVRIPLTNREQFDSLKNAGKLPFGQLPALQINEQGDMITQSATIMRYLGKLSGAYPSCPIAAALVDSLVDEEVDLTSGLATSRYKERFGYGCLDTETITIVRKSLNDEVIPRHLQFLDNIAGKSKTGWIANTADPSIADFLLVPRFVYSHTCIYLSVF
jgi:glutathione S-transferase